MLKRMLWPCLTDEWVEPHWHRWGIRWVPPLFSCRRGMPCSRTKAKPAPQLRMRVNKTTRSDGKVVEANDVH